MPAFTGLDAFCDENAAIDLKGICLASGIGVFLGLIASRAHRNKWIPRLARAIRVSNRTGDEDLWEFFHDTTNTDWIIVRDHDYHLVYYGGVRQYSESEKDRELLLENVSVYSDEDNIVVFMYETPALYIARDKNKISIELPMQPSQSKKD
jgi:hypothetical protein